MAELTNSRRISYKATYCQAAPTLTPAAGQHGAAVVPAGRAPPPLTRALEKAAFLQSLGMTSLELADIRAALTGGRKPPANAAQIGAVLDAIGALITDKTSASTLNQARRFVAVDTVDLLTVCRSLLTQREKLTNSVNRVVGDIFEAYRAALAAPVAASAAPPAKEPAQPPPAGSVQRMLVSSTGLAVITTLTPLPSTPVKGNSSNERHGFSLTIALDPNGSVPPAFAGFPILSLTAYQPSQEAVLRWADRNRPDLFATLASAVAPYLAIDPSLVRALEPAKVLAQALGSRLPPIINVPSLQGAMDGFQKRMAIEPVGNLHLERIEMYPAGVERGELITSIPLAPGETINISHKEWSVTEREFEDIVQDYLEGYSEQGVAEKSDIAMSNDSQAQHATALSVGASLSASYSSITLSTNVGYNATNNDSQSKKDSRTHSMTLTKKAAARTKKEHKVTFKVTSVAGSEDQAVRVISNPSDTNAMRIDYFQLARKWKVDLLRYGLRMTYDITIPDPGSALMTLVREVEDLNTLINTPFTFDLPLNSILYNPDAKSTDVVSNYDQLAADFGATVTPPPSPSIWVNAHKETEMVKDYNDLHFDSLDFEIDDNYFIVSGLIEYQDQVNHNETKDYFTMLNGEGVDVGVSHLAGMSGHLSLDFVYQYVFNYAINITFTCNVKAQVIADWRLQAWNQMRAAAEDAYNKDLQGYRDRQSQLIQQIADFDALTLRRMEQEEIMKGVLRWLLGPNFELLPTDLSNLFISDSNDPEVSDVLDPNRMSAEEWMEVITNGEFIKYIHNAIEWENVLYFTYPYFWDDNKLWDFKKFLYHPDATHRTFLRAGAARVVLTIRPGFEDSFTQLVEGGAFAALAAGHPYVTIAQEIQDFANTNYPGFPPANPEQEARPLLYLEQRRVWREMQFIIQLLNAYKAANGVFPDDAGTGQIPAAMLTPYLDGAITINGENYAGINGYNVAVNTKQITLDPTTPAEALLPTSTAVPIKDVAWGNPYVYKCPGDTGDYDLVSLGADGKIGGLDKSADISSNCEASLIATWYEYTPTGAMDIGITTNPPNQVPAQPDPQIS